MSRWLLLLPPVLMVIVLAVMGRPWWCGCDSYAIYTTGSAHYSQHLFDSWTFSHVFHGGFFYGTFRGFMLGYSRTTAVFLSLAIEGAWEAIENTHWAIIAYRASGDRFYLGDSIWNSVGDLFACYVGALALCFILQTAKGSES